MRLSGQRSTSVNTEAVTSGLPLADVWSRRPVAHLIIRNGMAGTLYYTALRSPRSQSGVRGMDRTKSTEREKSSFVAVGHKA